MTSLRQSTPPTSGSSSAPASQPGHRASENQSVADLAISAAKDALEASGVTGENIEAVIISTISHPYATPSLATLVADAIGSKCPAYDISAACAGFCYGIAQADALVRAGTAKHVLVIGVEKLSDFIDNTERTISFLLGDGAGAAVVGVSDEPGIAPTVWGSDGSRWGTVGMTHSLLDIRNRDFVANPVEEGEKIWPTLRQDGPSVFRWAVWEMAKVAKQALETAGITPDELARSSRTRQMPASLTRWSRPSSFPTRWQWHAISSMPVTPPPHPSPSPRTACSRRTRNSPASSPCRSVSVPAWHSQLR